MASVRLCSLALGAAAFLALAGQTSPGSAHIVGAFADFLAGIEDETTLVRLQQQLDETEAKIGELTPQVDALAVEYEERADAALAKLLFYKSVWLDSLSALVLESGDLVDVIANQRLLSRKVDQDIASLNTLYLKFKQLEVARDALVGHQDVLRMIQSNLEARATLLDRYGMLSPERLARIVSVMWENSAAAYVDEYLIADAKVVNRDPSLFFTRRTEQSAFILPQQRLNEINDEKLTEDPSDGTTGQQISGKLSYNIRPDHVYIHYINHDADEELVDLILIGQIGHAGDQDAILSFEAGYLNGIVLPTDYLMQLEGFVIDYRALNPGSIGFVAEQMSGALVIQPLEGSGE